MSSRDKRFVLHVGAHVTGVRHVQKYLRENVDLLGTRRVHYVQRELMGKYVGWGPKVVDDPEQFGQVVRRALRSPETDVVLASHENTIGHPFVEDIGGLYPSALPTFETLADLTKPYRCTIVLGVRPQADFLEAYYLQMVNAGELDPFDSWLSRLDLDDISWMPLHEQLVATFGADAVRVLDHRRVDSDQATYVREFFRIIDLDLPTEVHAAPARSVGHSEKSLRVALAANRYLRAADERASMRTFLHRHFSDRNYPPARLLTDGQRASLNDRYGDEYERLVATEPAGGIRS